jgi:hypothetical protein
LFFSEPGQKRLFLNRIRIKKQRGKIRIGDVIAARLDWNVTNGQTWNEWDKFSDFTWT